MTKRSPSEIDERVYEMQASICKAFANPVRLRILDLLSKTEQSVSELQEALGITAANASQHLSILKGAGIVSTRRNGKQTICSLSMPQVKTACEMIREVLRARLQQGQNLVV